MPLNGSDLKTYTTLLKELGIEFDVRALKKLTDDQLANFTDAVEGIKAQFSQMSEQGKAKTDAEVAKDEAEGTIARGVAVLTSRTLGIEKRLMQLGLTQAIIENKGLESTYFNMSGERTQTFIGGNALSNLHDVLSKLNNFTVYQVILRTNSTNIYAQIYLLKRKCDDEEDVQLKSYKRNR